MTWLQDHLLTAVLFWPALAAVPMLVLPDRWWPWMRRAALAAALADLGLSLLLLRSAPAPGEFAWLEITPWIPAYGISYRLGVDGLSLTMVILTAFLTPLAILAPFDGRGRHRSAFYASLLLLESAVLGVFMSLDLILFYLFWEAVLIPAWFIVGLWGGEKRIRAAVKFFIYTLAGSLCMLVGIIVLYREHLDKAGAGSFALQDLTALSLSPGLQGWLFVLFFLAFAVKAPLFPFHTWLPGAYGEAPTPGTILLAGVLAKMGTYGFLRYGLPLFPEAVRVFAPWAAGLAAAGIIYGALLALAQDDLKMAFAYASFSHVSFILLGIFSMRYQGLLGASFQMFSHGLVAAGMFILAGAVWRRRGTRSLSGLAGAAWGAPMTWEMTFFLLAALGLPGLSPFVGEFLVVSGAFRQHPAFGCLAVAGVAAGAFYLLRILGRTVWNGAAGAALPDGASPAAAGEAAGLACLAAVIVWLGLNPGPLVRLLQPGMEAILKKLGGG